MIRARGRVIHGARGIEASRETDAFVPQNDTPVLAGKEGKGLYMMRGFLSGVFWGSAAAALGLGAVSQLTPLPVARIAADASTVERAKPVPVAPKIEPETAVAQPTDAESADQIVTPAVEPGAVEPVLVKPDAEEPVVPKPTAEPVAEPVIDPVVPSANAAQQLDPPAGSEFSKPLPDLDPVLPAAESEPPDAIADTAPVKLPASDAASLTDKPTAAPETGLIVPKQPDVPTDESAALPPIAEKSDQFALAEPDQPTAPLADAPPAPTPNPSAAEKPEPDEPLIEPSVIAPPAPEVDEAPSLQLTPDPVLVPESDAANETAIENAGTQAPTPELGGTVDGVTIGRLPRIGDAVLPEGETETVLVEPAPEDAGVETDPSLAIDGEIDLPPLQKYARAFENVDAKPLFTIILIDTGGADLDRAALAALPFPVTFALDPLDPDVAAASKIYRDAGQEVIMVATGIPAGATASDLEVTFQAHASALPEAVAVIDTEFGSFQADRPLATQVVPILQAQGRGLISWDRGLNAADQVARREGLAATTVFRKLDGKGETAAAVRRALDRAAFKAVQLGRVTVIGQTIPETVAALQEWAVEGRVTSVALAPVSAVLTTQ